MKPPFPFDGMVVFAFLSIMLLMGVLLRARVPLLQRYLFPSCLIGGFLGLLLIQFNAVKIDPSAIETVAYHFFNLSFISVGLTGHDPSTARVTGKKMLKGPSWMALTQGIAFSLQASMGGLLVIIMGLFGISLFPTFGFLAPLGFEEGPGQALSIGKVWETFGFADAATIGLTFAAIGYFFAFFVGVPLVNLGIRKGLSTFGPKTLPADFLKGILSKKENRETAGVLTLHTASTETLAFQAALVGMVYGLTYLLVKFLGTFLSPDAAAILWGFFFFFGLGVALMVKWLMNRLGIDHLADPGIQRRITGWSIDFLIVATVAAIELAVVWDYILPISVISLVNGILSTLAVVWLGKRLDAYHLERSAAIYGAVTGTVSCGLLLLRIVDPDFKTPVAYEIAVMNIFSLPVIGGCTVLVNATLWWGWSLTGTIFVYLGIMGVLLFMLHLMGFLTEKKVRTEKTNP